MYLLILAAGGLAVNFALDTPEWSSPVVALGWLLLAQWTWFYGVAFQYRRRLLRFTSTTMVLLLSAALTALTLDRAAAQVAMAGPQTLAERESAVALYWAAGATVLVAGLLVLHLVFLGTGYRQKKGSR